MIEGVLSRTAKGHDGELTITARISPDGWASDIDWFERMLKSAFPLPATEAGEPFVIAFYDAVRELNLTVVQVPRPDPWPGIS